MMGGPLLAASPHEMCNAMRHSCDRIDALASCCCGDRSDNNPSRAPAGRAEPANAASAVVAGPVILPAVPVAFFPVGAPAVARPPDLPILFSDLRI
jgi:hypothetical protein